MSDDKKFQPGEKVWVRRWSREHEGVIDSRNLYDGPFYVAKEQEHTVDLHFLKDRPETICHSKSVIRKRMEMRAVANRQIAEWQELLAEVDNE